jgi:hypothetical protein
MTQRRVVCLPQHLPRGIQDDYCPDIWCCPSLSCKWQGNRLMISTISDRPLVGLGYVREFVLSLTSFASHRARISNESEQDGMLTSLFLAKVEATWQATDCKRMFGVGCLCQICGTTTSLAKCITVTVALLRGSFKAMFSEDGNILVIF